DLLLDDGLGDLAGDDEGADAALGEVLADGAHALADAGAVGIVLAAVGVVVGGAGHLDGEADGAGLGGQGEGAEGGRGCETGADLGHGSLHRAESASATRRQTLMEAVCARSRPPAVPGG